jgi:hypothetical protein
MDPHPLVGMRANEVLKVMVILGENLLGASRRVELGRVDFKPETLGADDKRAYEASVETFPEIDQR